MHLYKDPTFNPLSSGAQFLGDVIDSAPRHVNLHQYHVSPVLKRHVTFEILDENQEQGNLTVDVYECDEHYLEGDSWNDSMECPVHYRFHDASNVLDLGGYATDLDYRQFRGDAGFQIEDESFEMNDAFMISSVTPGYVGPNHYHTESYDYADDENYYDDGRDEEMFSVFQVGGDGQHAPDLCETYDISDDGCLDSFVSDFPSVDNACNGNESGQMDESLAFASPELMASAETSIDGAGDDSLGGLHNFLGGRELLCGFSEAFSREFERPGPTASAEAQVAKTLRDHWLPQRL
ncbi:uncharacterized protein EV420DRAFT_456595 [Desarmillaria tabescens]|uniref:Uncharacterized protein n=1 Tax=Armillaria tabescens TaxID=1929756 RepID=A0AA39T6P4_ARMTA|nr:uncharacterized protein EV420DRAFT_456595 [Desarmillaria tabescens]KAK0468296.1 hypothetical protein EV420DRAFT_456595 [Desarmillaria tabescens]